MNRVVMDSNSSMKIGLRLQQTDEHLAAREKFHSSSKTAENAGFDSLWILDRLSFFYIL
ncbi:MAG: hypothetical protein ACJ71P_00890 [Nitrososphaeraceae archaeon]